MGLLNKGNMKKTCIILILLVTSTIRIIAQEQGQEQALDYRRSSLYSLMINHTEQQFASEIKEAFLQIPLPDKFNDHNLSVRVLDMDSKLKGASKGSENKHITEFLQDNKIASRLVARWFNRDFYTGACNMELVKERGLYNASEFQKELAMHSARGMAMLQDAGEDLIGNTFVVVNDIRYVDKNEGAKVAGSILKVVGSAVAAYTGSSEYEDLGNLVGDMVETIKGFTVKINTFLYQLDWTDEQANLFYAEQYGNGIDQSKWENFETARPNYQLKYVGKVESKGGTTSFMGINEDEPVVMVRKACQRAIDENVVDLQRNYEEFRIKVPLVSVEPLTAYIGMKEGVNPESKYEVLEVIQTENGKRKYKRVGIIAPVENLIWDNRYMAAEEGAVGAHLGYTTFRAISGKDFYKGMLIREMSNK